MIGTSGFSRSRPLWHLFEAGLLGHSSGVVGVLVKDLVGSEVGKEGSFENLVGVFESIGPAKWEGSFVSA